MKKKTIVLLTSLLLTSFFVSMSKQENIVSFANSEVSNLTIETILATDARLQYSGTWEYPTVASTCTPGNSVSFTGIFTQIDYYGEASPMLLIS